MTTEDTHLLDDAAAGDAPRATSEHDTEILIPGTKSTSSPHTSQNNVETRNQTTQHTVNLTNGTGGRHASLTSRRYLTSNDSKRNLRAAQEAAQNDPYELKEMMAQGAEAILYRGTSGAFTYCVKCIRNNWSKLLGGAGSGSGGEKLKNVKYSTKLRHIHNEFAIAQKLTQEVEMPIVRMFALRRVTRLGVEIGYDLLMEHLSGHDLSDKVLQRVLPLSDKVKVLYDATCALDFVHRKKIIHLDIKPSNFMLAGGIVKLIDFGVSVERGYQATSVTGTGGYMSPEQICKDTIDEGTDLFALGIAFGVFFGGRPLNQPQDELMTKQSRQEARFQLDSLEQPLLRDTPALNELPKIAEVLRRCTIPRRDKRISSCHQLMHELKIAAEQHNITL